MRIAFEKVVPDAGSSFALLDRKDVRFDGKYHFHPEFEITLIESATGRRVVGDSIASFAPGDLVLLGENLPHQYVSHPVPRGAWARAKVIQFRRDFAGEPFLRSPELANIARLLDRGRRGLKFDGPTVAAARRQIAAVFGAAGFVRLRAFLDLLHTLSCSRHALPIASAGYAPRISTRESETVDRAMHYLNQRFAQPLTLTDLCRYLHVTPATCNRLFRKSVGRSFKAMLIELRIGHACRLLAETDQPVVDVAYASGFANLSNFNRRFRQLKGMAPRGFRRELRR